MSTRNLVQKPVVILIIPAIQMLCVAISMSLSVLCKFTGGVSFEKFNKYISEINHVKSESNNQRQSYTVQKEIKKERKCKNIEAVEKDVKVRDENVPNPLRNTTDNKEVFYDCKEEVDPLNKSTSKLYNNLFLSVIVYSSAIYIFVQLSTLVYLLNNSTLKPGLIFLLICLGYLAFMVFKISFVEKSNRKEIKVGNFKQVSKVTADECSKKSTVAVTSQIKQRPVVKVLPQTRHRSRSLTRKDSSPVIINKEKLL
ncbi:unnamed protein product [Diamesa hyperborea]